MSPYQFCLAYAESHWVWFGFKPPLPPHNARFSLGRVLVFTAGQTLAGAVVGWFIGMLLGVATSGAGPLVLFNGPFSWLIWLLAALSACQGILGYGFTALCWNQRAARLLADPSLDVSINFSRYPVLRWLTGLFYFVLFALIAPIALLWTIENVRGEWLWRIERNILVAQGECLSFQEIAGPTVPPEQNAGAAPIFAPFFDYQLKKGSDGRWEAGWFDSNGLQRVEERLKFPPRLWPTEERDLLSSSNAIAANLSAWAASYRKLVATPANDDPAWVRTLKLPADTNDTARTVLAGLSIAEEDLKQICDASARPRSQFPIHHEEGFNVSLRHLSVLKSVHQKLALRCAARLQSGDTNGAFADAQCSLRVAELLREEPLLISQLVRYGQSALAVRTVWLGLAEHRWTEEELAAFQSWFSQVNYLPGLELAFQGERACCIQAFDGWVSGGSPSEMIGPDENNGPLRLPTRLLSRGMLRQNELTMLRFQQQMIASMRRAISNSPTMGLVVVTHDVSNVVQRAQNDLKPFSPYKVMAAMLAPAVGRAIEKTARQQTIARLAETACALERYRLKHGGFPEKLDDLAPAFLPAVPLDPMSGQPFHYSRTNDGWFLLYSVGLNGRDEGGQFIVTKEKKSDELDWPWPVPTLLAKKNLF